MCIFWLPVFVAFEWRIERLRAVETDVVYDAAAHAGRMSVLHCLSDSDDDRASAASTRTVSAMRRSAGQRGGGAKCRVHARCHVRLSVRSQALIDWRQHWRFSHACQRSVVERSEIRQRRQEQAHSAAVEVRVVACRFALDLGRLRHRMSKRKEKCNVFFLLFKNRILLSAIWYSQARWICCSNAIQQQRNRRIHFQCCT